MGAPLEKGMAWMVREHAYTNAGARIALIDKRIIVLPFGGFAYALVSQLAAISVSRSWTRSSPCQRSTTIWPAACKARPRFSKSAFAKRLANGTEGNRIHEFSVV